MIHTIVIAAVTAAVATDLGRWDAFTISLVAAQLCFSAFLYVFPWGGYSHNVFAKVYFFGAGSFVVGAFYFDDPYLLLGVFPEMVAFADIYWYRRSRLVMHIAPLLTAFVVGSLVIDGTNVALLVIGTPVLLGGALLVGGISSLFIKTLLTRQRFQSTVVSLLEALHARDGYTGEHSEVTLAMTTVVANELGLKSKLRRDLVDIALLHDIGKIGIPNSILHKPGSLDEDEWEIMRRHPEIGERILCDVPGFESVARAIRHEHERWDGDGYPDGLAGDDIPLASRIVLTCDAFHAMVSDRPYRKAMDRSSALDELLANAGTQFDPKVVDALFRAIESGELDREIETLRASPEEPAEASRMVATTASDHGTEQAKTGVASETSRSLVVDYAFAPTEELKDPLSDPVVRMWMTAQNWAQAAIVMSVYLAATHFDMVGAVFVVFATAMVAITFSLHKIGSPKIWALFSGMVANVAIPVLAGVMHEPALMLLLLGSAMITTTIFWHIPWLRAIQVTLVVFEFSALPVLIFGTEVVPFAAVSARAFPGVILLMGIFAPRLREMTFDRRRFATTMQSLLSALQARDGYTGDHSLQTVELAMRVAGALGLQPTEQSELNDVAMLHDIGKIGIPDEVLNKPGSLSASEWEIMRRHPEIGEQIVIRIPGYETVAKAIRHEHERWDGDGYPDGLAGDAIPLASRIVLACDAYHAMTSDRPYRAALAVPTAMAELAANAGTQFDPRIAEALLNVLGGGCDDATNGGGTSTAMAVA